MSQKVTFTLSPEIVANATEGLLLGDFNNWLHEQGIQLKKQKDGSMKAIVSLEPGVYQYRYFLNDGRWVNDGNAQHYSQVGEYGVENCVIAVEAPSSKKPATKAVKAKEVKEVENKTAKPAVKKEVVKKEAAKAKTTPAKKAEKPVVVAKAAPKKAEPKVEAPKKAVAKKGAAKKGK